MTLPLPVQQTLNNAIQHRISKINLSNMQLNDSHMQELANLLNNNDYRHITTVDLTHNQITIAGARAFILANQSITKLSIYNGNLTISNLTELQQLILSHRTIHECPIIGGNAETFRPFRNAIGNKQLQPILIPRVQAQPTLTGATLIPNQPQPQNTIQKTVPIVAMPVMNIQVTPKTEIKTQHPPLPQTKVKINIHQTTTTTALVTTHTNQTTQVATTIPQKYLGLTDQPLGDLNPNYIISMVPINSSGDIYHIVTYLFLCLLTNRQPLNVQLTFDTDDTNRQAELGLLFANILHLGQYFNPPVRINENAASFHEPVRQAALHRYFQAVPQNIYYVDQKALTTIISREFIHNRNTLSARLRNEYRRRNPSYFPLKVSNEIQLITDEWHNAIQGSIGQKRLIIFHVRYSMAANKEQNLDDEFISRFKIYLEEKGYAVWFIFADSRKSKSFTGIKAQRISPFSEKILARLTQHDNHDYGKILHLQILDRLLDLPQLHGVIGNTSGTLDLAAFIGHRVFNIHNFTHADISYQEYRILLQVSFFTVEKFFAEHFKAFQINRNRVFSDDLVRQIIPTFLNWLNRINENNLRPTIPIPGNINLTLTGFIELIFIRTWRKLNDVRDFTEAIPNHHETTPYLGKIPIADEMNTFINTAPNIITTTASEGNLVINPGNVAGMYANNDRTPTPYHTLTGTAVNAVVKNVTNGNLNDATIISNPKAAPDHTGLKNSNA